jgi:hypothetical protein
MEVHPTINKAMADNFQKHFLESVTSGAAFEGFTFLWDSVPTRGPAVIKTGLFRVTEGPRAFSLKEWLAHGGMSADEPEVPAALRHFYDPLGIDQGKRFLTDRATYWEGLINNEISNPFIDAVTWALDAPDNPWTWKNGATYLRQALETADDDTREGLLARAWRSLGEVLHLVADMGCPPHVRNDSHAAPLGWEGGWALGDPDPFEELVARVNVAELSRGKPDLSLKDTFAKARVPRQVFETLATFTNANFFTRETIVGQGVESYLPIIDDRPPYPSPRLERLEYDPLSFTFWAKLPQGRVMMAKDRVYGSMRGYPYIDQDVVTSQASVLLPNVVAAGTQVMRMFFPRLTVEITEAKANGKIKGRVIHTPNEIYREAIAYRGRVRLITNDMAESAVMAEDGVFETDATGMNPGDKLTAVIDFGGVSVRSPQVTLASPAAGATSFSRQWKVEANGWEYVLTLKGSASGAAPRVKYASDRPVVTLATPAGKDSYSVSGQLNVDLDKWEKVYVSPDGRVKDVSRVRRVWFEPYHKNITGDCSTLSVASEAPAFSLTFKPYKIGPPHVWQHCAAAWRVHADYESERYVNGALTLKNAFTGYVKTAEIWRVNQD